MILSAYITPKELELSNARLTDWRTSGPTGKCDLLWVGNGPSPFVIMVPTKDLAKVIFEEWRK